MHKMLLYTHLHETHNLFEHVIQQITVSTIGTSLFPILYTWQSVRRALELIKNTEPKSCLNKGINADVIKPRTYRYETRMKLQLTRILQFNETLSDSQRRTKIHSSYSFSK